MGGVLSSQSPSPEGPGPPIQQQQRQQQQHQQRVATARNGAINTGIVTLDFLGILMLMQCKNLHIYLKLM